MDVVALLYQHHCDTALTAHSWKRTTAVHHLQLSHDQAAQLSDHLEETPAEPTNNIWKLTTESLDETKTDCKIRINLYQYDFKVVKLQKT